jgi:DNA-directed RNA polymerase specialized sigma24 family protein
MRSELDSELVAQAQAGDQDAFARLVAASAGRLHSVAFNILRDHELAKDATQQALLSIWQALPALRDPARVDAWAYRTVVRACYAASAAGEGFVPADQRWNARSSSSSAT